MSFLWHVSQKWTIYVIAQIIRTITVHIDSDQDLILSYPSLLQYSPFLSELPEG